MLVSNHGSIFCLQSKKVCSIYILLTMGTDGGTCELLDGVPEELLEDEDDIFKSLFLKLAPALFDAQNRQI